MSILYRPNRHRCTLDFPHERGIIARCEGCGRLWRSVYPGNPKYAGWKPAGPLYRLVFRKRLREGQQR